MWWISRRAAVDGDAVGRIDERATRYVLDGPSRGESGRTRSVTTRSARAKAVKLTPAPLDKGVAENDRVGAGDGARSCRARWSWVPPRRPAILIFITGHGHTCTTLPLSCVATACGDGMNVRIPAFWPLVSHPIHRWPATTASWSLGVCLASSSMTRSCVGQVIASMSCPQVMEPFGSVTGSWGSHHPRASRLPNSDGSDRVVRFAAGQLVDQIDRQDPAWPGMPEPIWRCGRLTAMPAWRREGSHRTPRGRRKWQSRRGLERSVTAPRLRTDSTIQCDARWRAARPLAPPRRWRHRRRGRSTCGETSSRRWYHDEWRAEFAQVRIVDSHFAEGRNGALWVLTEERVVVTDVKQPELVDGFSTGQDIQPVGPIDDWGDSRAKRSCRAQRFSRVINPRASWMWTWWPQCQATGFDRSRRL